MVEISDLKLGDIITLRLSRHLNDKSFRTICWNSYPDDFAKSFNKQLYYISDEDFRVVALSASKCFIDASSIDNSGWELDGAHILSYNIFSHDTNHIGKLTYYVLDYSILKKVDNSLPASTYREPGGCACNHCKEFIPYAEPNQTNGTLLCYSCRQNPYR